MEINNERNMQYTLFDITKITKEESEQLQSYALDKIKNDPDALINYAVNKLLEEYIISKDNELTDIVNALPENKGKKYKKELDKIRKEKTCKTKPLMVT